MLTQLLWRVALAALLRPSAPARNYPRLLRDSQLALSPTEMASRPPRRPRPPAQWRRGAPSPYPSLLISPSHAPRS